MPDQFAYAAEEARQAREAVNSAADHGHNALVDAVGAAERIIDSFAKSAEHLLKDSLDGLRDQTESYRDEAWRHLDEGQRYVVDHVKQRPVSFTLAGLGIGLLVGVLLANRPK
jgi:ElaB/YqjD/DUF883 family membrane-anchored ribosome-binding protein